MFSKEKLEVKRVPMMPVRDMVIFPEMMHPFIVGREASVRALEEALAGDKKIFLVTQHDASVDDPKPEEIYQVGTLANIVQSVKLPDGNIKVLVEGSERAKIVQVTSDEGFFRATVRLVPVKSEPGPQTQQASERVTNLFEQYVKLSQSLNYDTMIAAVRVEDPGKLSDAIAANLQIPVEEKQELLEIFDPLERLNRIADILEVEIEKLNVDRSINTRVKRQMERAQKEYYLNEKLKAIQKELGPRRSERNRAAEEENRNFRHARRADGKGHAGAEAAGNDAADVGRIHRLAQLSRLAAGCALEEALEGNSRHQARRRDSVRGSLRPRKDQRAHPRISGGPPAREEPERLDSLLPRASGSRQDVAGDVDRPRHGTQIRPRVARRRARRSRNPRPSPHLYRRPARPDHPDDAEGRHDQPGVRPRRSGQDVDGLPRRSIRGADGSARPGTEPRVHRPLSRRRIRPLEGHVHLHGQRAAHDSAALAGPHGSSAPARLYRAGKVSDRAALPGSPPTRSDGLEQGKSSASPTRR